MTSISQLSDVVKSLIEAESARKKMVGVSESYHKLNKFLADEHTKIEGLLSNELKVMENTHLCQLTDEELVGVLSVSILGPFMNKIKCVCENP